jgi:hypothetical protein
MEKSVTHILGIWTLVCTDVSTVTQEEVLQLSYKKIHFQQWIITQLCSNHILFLLCFHGIVLALPLPTAYTLMYLQMTVLIK